MNRNYMVIHSELQWNDTYTMRMISGNKIPGLLGFHEKWVDGRAMFYYDITSKQPLSRLLEHRKLTAWEIRRLISDLILVLRQMERYLLGERRLCLMPEYIYVEPESYHCSLCMIPGYWSDFAKGFLDLAQYFLDHVDHSDGDAVVLAFAVFRECRKENFGVDDIERCLGSREGEGVQEEAHSALIESHSASIETHSAPIESMDWASFLGIQMQEEQGIIHNEQRKKNNEEEKKNVLQKLPRMMLVFLAGGLVVIPAIAVLLFGIEKVLQWKWILAAVELVLASGLILMLRIQKGAEEIDLSVERALDLENIMETEENIWTNEGNRGDQEIVMKGQMVEYADEDDMQTVLLTSRAEVQAKKKLISISDRLEIPLDYFPFLIGKSKSLTDFCLNEPGISRLHMKLDLIDGEYFITDLNSTNGTRLNGELLNANETKLVHTGDEVALAGILFRFQ